MVKIMTVMDKSTMDCADPVHPNVELETRSALQEAGNTVMLQNHKKRYVTHVTTIATEK